MKGILVSFKAVDKLLGDHFLLKGGEAIPISRLKYRELLFQQSRAAPVEGSAQLVIAERLHQIIRGIHLIAIRCKIRCGCCKDQLSMLIYYHK